jgi:hypothetical protein
VVVLRRFTIRVRAVPIALGIGAFEHPGVSVLARAAPICSGVFTVRCRLGQGFGTDLRSDLRLCLGCCVVPHRRRAVTHSSGVIALLSRTVTSIGSVISPIRGFIPAIRSCISFIRSFFTRGPLVDGLVCSHTTPSNDGGFPPPSSST